MGEPTCRSGNHVLSQLARGLVMLCMLASVGCTGFVGYDRLPWDEMHLIDLTHSFGADTIVWPTEPDFRLVSQKAGQQTAGGYYYASNRLEMAEHGGTHIDAPVHFAEGGETLDQVPIEQLTGIAIRVDVSSLCANDRDYQVTIQDIQQWEAEYGQIRPRAIVLVDTGFARYWPSRQDYLGTELRGQDGVRALHFPGLHPDAATWLVRERLVKAVGIDTASIDYGQTTTFETHIAFLSRNVPIFENLADLSRLPPTGFDVVALPMKIAGGTGGPLRIIAVLRPAP